MNGRRRSLADIADGHGRFSAAGTRAPAYGGVAQVAASPASTALPARRSANRANREALGIGEAGQSPAAQSPARII
jgi:hypothetical protein